MVLVVSGQVWVGFWRLLVGSSESWWRPVALGGSGGFWRILVCPGAFRWFLMRSGQFWWCVVAFECFD